MGALTTVKDETYIERFRGFGSIRRRALVAGLKVGHRVGDRMHNGLHSRHPSSPPMQCHERRLAPTGERDQQIVPARKHDGDACVDEAEGARPISHILACFELRRHEPDVGREGAEGDGRENDVQADVDANEDAEYPPRQVAHLSGKRLEPPGPQQSRQKGGGL